MKTGFIAIVGRTNVGKSTLLNAILGEKISIVSDKPQTTRSRIAGIYNRDGVQAVFLDTPGLHAPKNKLGQAMLQAAWESLAEADLILLTAECRRPGEEERQLIGRITLSGIPCILVLTKIDKIEKNKILEVIDQYAHLHSFAAVVPLCAPRQDGVDLLMDEILSRLPESDTLFYSTESATDRSERYLASELVREKLLRNLREEVPHGTAVETVLFEDGPEGGVTRIFVNIICERESHKGIIIGRQGQTLKRIATQAREEIEELLGRKVFLECRVKVREGWRDDERLIGEYNEF